jgi:hypothetical protein
MPDLATQLREYVDALCEAPAVDVPVATMPPHRSRGRLVAVAVAVAAALLATVLVVAQRDDADVQTIAPGPDEPTRSGWTLTGGTIPSPQAITSTVFTRHGLLATGAVHGDDQDQAVWRSLDSGRTWEEAWSPVNVVVGFSAVATLLDLGEEVLWLHTGTGGSAAWRTTDTTQWTRVDVPFPGQRVRATAEGGGIAYALTAGPEESPRATLWRTTDGVSWTRVRDFPAGEQLVNVAAGPTGLVVVGAAVGASLTVPIVWSGTHGGDWTRVELPGSTIPGAAIAVGERFSLVGEQGQAAWVGSGDRWGFAEGLAPDVPQLVRGKWPISAGDYGALARDDRGFVWRSRDGQRWERLDLQGDAPRAIQAWVGTTTEAFAWDTESPRALWRLDVGEDAPTSSPAEEIDARCQGEQSAAADLDGDGREDRAYGYWDPTRERSMIGACTATGAHSEIPAESEGSFGVAQLAPDRWFILAGGSWATGHLDNVFTLVDGHLVRLDLGLVVEVPYPEGDRRFWGCRSGPMVAQVVVEASGAWTRRAYDIDGTVVRVASEDTGTLSRAQLAELRADGLRADLVEACPTK